MHEFLVATSKHCLFACLIVASLALLASNNPCQAISIRYFLCLSKALFASPTSFPVSSNYQGMQKGASFYKEACLSITFFILEIKISIEKSILEIHENFLRNVQISFTFSFMAYTYAFFDTGCSSACINATHKKTGSICKWSDL